MKAVIQRVKQASVNAAGECTGKIQAGLLVYLGIGKGDSADDASFIANKLADLRIFEDSTGRMNLSIDAVEGEILLISNFTICGDCRKGRRPGFDAAECPERAAELYEMVCSMVENRGISVKKGVFGEHMHVSSINDGPVTFVLETPGFLTKSKKQNR